MNGPSGTIPEHFYLTDFVNYFHSPRRRAASMYADLARKGLTATQISGQTGLSKQAILKRLRIEGVRPRIGHGRQPENYRYPNPAFGLRVVNGQLVASPREMKIVRLIVKLREKERLSWEAIAVHLDTKRFFSRYGKKWDRSRIKKIYLRWTNKI